MLAEIASSVPIPPNIDIVVRLLLLVTSKNEIKQICRVAAKALVIGEPIVQVTRPSTVI